MLRPSRQHATRGQGGSPRALGEEGANQSDGGPGIFFHDPMSGVRNHAFFHVARREAHHRCHGKAKGLLAAQRRPRFRRADGLVLAGGRARPARARWSAARWDCRASRRRTRPASDLQDQGQDHGFALESLIDEPPHGGADSIRERLTIPPLRALHLIEGLANGDQLHPLQEGFWEEHGLQCGYCTPGLVLAAKSLPLVGFVLLGGVWAMVQPLFAMLIFTVFFHRLAGLNGDKNVPYPLFAFAGLSAWTFFSTALSQSSNSLIANNAMVKKVYFPRLFLPLASIGALLVDLAFSLLFLGLLMLKYHWRLTGSILLLPLFIFGTLLASAGLGMTLSAVNVLFLYLKYFVPLLVQMGIFVTPVIYPIGYIPKKWMLLIGVNPMSGMVLGFRHALL